MRHSWHNPDFQWYKPLSCGLPEYSLQRGDAHGGHAHGGHARDGHARGHVRSNSRHRGDDDVHVHDHDAHVILYT